MLEIVIEREKSKRSTENGHSKSQNGQQKILHSKDTHVYNNCFSTRAIEQLKTKNQGFHKIEKNSKNQGEIATCEQKMIGEKANICSNNVFSLFFKIRVKRFHAAKPLSFFCSTSFFGMTKITTPIWLGSPKIIKMCEQMLK